MTPKPSSSASLLSSYYVFLKKIISLSPFYLAFLSATFYLSAPVSVWAAIKNATDWVA